MDPALENRLFLLDGSSLAYRAFFALPEGISTREGFPTNAMYGLSQMLLKIVTEYRPASIVVAWDAREKTFRHEEFEAYKAERPHMPEPLSQQWSRFPELMEAFGIVNLVKPGDEADDIRGTLAEDVVGRVARLHQVDDAERLHQLGEAAPLLRQRLRHVRALRLVGFELLMAKGLFARVPSHHDARRPVLGDDLEQHLAEPVHGVGRETFARTDALGQGEEGPVSEAAPVEQEEAVLQGGIHGAILQDAPQDLRSVVRPSGARPQDALAPPPPAPAGCKESPAPAGSRACGRSP